MIVLDHTTPETLLADLARHKDDGLFRFKFKDAKGIERVSPHRWRLVYSGFVSAPDCSPHGVWLHVKHIDSSPRLGQYGWRFFQSMVEFTLKDDGWLAPRKSMRAAFNKYVWRAVWRLLLDDGSLTGTDDSLRAKTDNNLRRVFS